MSVYSETLYRRQGLNALKVLLEEVGAVVLSTGKSQRVAGGTLYLAKRKRRLIRDIKSGEMRWIPETQRLVWRGPRIAPDERKRAATAKATPDSTGTAVQRQNAQGEAL